MHYKNGLCIAILCCMTSATYAQSTDRLSTVTTKPKNPVEIGMVNWGRDLEAALQASESSGKPVLVLFQEVPGCAGCQKFGREVLSQPLLAEAIEELFEPVFIFNNRGGKDAQILKRFGEPAWNYQVIRFLDAEAKDIVPRKDKIWSTAGVASRMIQALETAKRPVPKYLTTLAPVDSANDIDMAAFAMHCFWTGEYQLGQIDGVIGTEAGWLDGREVTLVKYDKSKLPLTKLATKAAQVKCADKVYTSKGEPLAGLRGGKLDRSYRTAKRSDQKRQISRWPEIQELDGINLMQLTKINSWAPRDAKTALAWLSPRQREQLNAANGN